MSIPLPKPAPAVMNGFLRLTCGACSKLLCMATPGSTVSIKCRGCGKVNIFAVPLDIAKRKPEAETVAP